jgi:hypothetical protein
MNGPMSKPAKKGKSGAAKFTAEERAAIKDRAKESDAGEGEETVLAKIAEMKEPDRAMGKRLHAVITAAVPGLEPRLWYGMPAYAKDGKVICFFQNAAKFKTRYATLGFSDKANLDDGSMWPCAYALKELTPAEEAKITALVRRAVG